ncbi:hypothetical protein Tco_0205577 [Tanacetum coccineum]
MYRPQLSSPPQAYSSSQCLGSQAYPSNPVQDNSPIKEVVPVKRKYTKRLQQSKKKGKDSNEPWSPKEEIALYKSWVNVFENIIDENQRKSQGFWTEETKKKSLMPRKNYSGSVAEGFSYIRKPVIKILLQQISAIRGTYLQTTRALIKQPNERSGTLIEQFLLSFGHDEGNDKGKDVDKETGNTKDEDLQKPSKEVLRSPFTKQIIEFSALKHLMPTNLWIYDGSTDQDDYVSRLVGSANQGEWEWTISSNPKKFIGAQTPKGRVPKKGHEALPQGDRPPRSTYGGGRKRTNYRNGFNVRQDHYEPYVPPRENNRRIGRIHQRTIDTDREIGKIELEVSFGNEGLYRRTMMKFTIMRASSPYKELRAIASTIHAMMKFLTSREEKAEEKDPERQEYSAVEEVLVNPAFPKQKVTIRTQCSKECRL